MPDPIPEFAAIVPCHNEADRLGEQLDALCEQRWRGRWEIVVVDNNSTDGTGDVARRHPCAVPVRVVDASDGAGVAYARNAGVRASEAPTFAFCDGDDVVEPGWVAAMASALREHELVAGAVDARRINPAWLAAARSSDGHDRLPTLGSIPFARGNNCGMHRTVWERLNGYDEDFVGLEDVEFTLRARQIGIEPVFVADAVVNYRFRDDLGSVWRQGQYYGIGQPALETFAASLGLAGRGRFGGLKSWAWLVLHLPDLRHRAGRYGWVWVLANRIGVLRGAIKERTLYV